jgi:predicted transcriptional regulator
LCDNNATILLYYHFATVLYSHLAVIFTSQLLNGASTPLTKTNMMYRAMVFYEQLKEYLVMLAQNEINVYDKPSRRFATIERGSQFVKRYDDLIELIEPIVTIAERTQEDNICQ